MELDLEQVGLMVLPETLLSVDIVNSYKKEGLYSTTSDIDEQ